MQLINVARFGPRYLRDLSKYKRLARSADSRVPLTTLLPVLGEHRDYAGEASGHYFYQDIWAARRIYARRPAEHIDVGSRIDGFVAHLLTFMPVTVVDIRPLTSSLTDLRFVQSDATRLEAFEADTIESISSLHAVEHFGLGRYGDPIDPDACFSAMRALCRVLRPGGHLYLSVPIGNERVEFNAHRVLQPTTVLHHCSDLRLVSFSAVGDDGRFYEDADPASFSGATYACGLFEFTKSKAVA